MNSNNTTNGNFSRTGENTGFSLKQIVLTAVIAVGIGVLSSSGMYPSDTPPIYRLPVFAAMVALILLLSAGRTGTFSRLKLLMLFLWLGFAAMSLIAELVNGEEMMSVAWMCLGVPYLIFCVFPRAAGRQGTRMVLLAIVLGFAPYIAASLLLYPLSSPYMGVFSNSNSLGMILATISAALFGLLRGAISNERKSVFHWIWIGTLCLCAGAAIPLIILSNSRTSLITYAGLLMVFVWSLFFNKYKNRWWIAFTAIALLGAVTLFMVSGLSDDARTNYFGRIFNKMETKALAGDISAGRFMIWEAVLNNVELFGRGLINFPQYYGGNAHNTYMTVLGGLGPLALIFLAAVHGMAVWLAYRHAVKSLKQDGYAIGPLLVILNYLVLGLAELVFGILGNGINMSFLLMLGILSNDPISGDSIARFSPAAGLTAATPAQLGSEPQ